MWARARENKDGIVPDEFVRKKTSEVVRKQKLYSPHVFNQSKCTVIAQGLNQNLTHYLNRKRSGR